MGSTPDIIGSHEVAEILEVSVRTAERLLKTGEIPIVYKSARGERLVTRADVERYAHQNS
jgi:excisionase family DNA binding protein